MNKLKLINQWLESFHEIERVFNALKEVTHASPESPLVVALYHTHKHYTDTLAALLDDQEGWLEWFLWENDCGKKVFEARAAHWEAPRPIRTAEDLLSLLTPP